MAITESPFKINFAELDRVVINEKAPTTDANIINIFYFGEIGQDKQEEQSNLIDLLSAIEDWKAWETTKCEQAVQLQITQKALPSDASIASRSKRTAYRAKVLEYLRNQSPWIINVSTGYTKQVPVPDEKPVDLAIVDALTNIEPLAANLPYRNFLKAIGAAFTPEAELVQPYNHTLVGFQYDNVIEKFQAVLLTVSFQIKMAQPKNSNDVRTREAAVIEFLSTPATFSVEQWNIAKPDPDTTKKGRELNLQKSMTVVALAQNE